MRKSEQREAIRERARAALRDLYHNATPNYPRELYGRSDDDAQAWFESAAEFEIEYLRDGGAYGNNYRATLAHPANAGKLRSERARAYYIAKGMRARDEERADCGALTGWRVLEFAVMAHGGKVGGQQRSALLALRRKSPGATRNNAMWEHISEFGKLYQWGRGGRTLAPDGLIRTGGGSSFSIREDYAYDLPIAAAVDLIRVVESFNRYVSAWCAGVPEMWREHCADEDAETRAAKTRATVRKAKETRERNYWAARDVVTI